VNTFAHIKPIARYHKVAYYSVCINGNSVSLFEEFIQTHDQQHTEKLNHVLAWLKLIGDKYGAKSHLFRSEAAIADASALPPKGKDREPCYTELGKSKANNLRLYCLRANDNVVFFFNGAIKTTHYAQDCSQVKEHFLLANHLTKAINQAFAEKEIVWNSDFTLVHYSTDFKLFF
jgi:hypothetical protein